jgi:hypothetical protein
VTNQRAGPIPSRKVSLARALFVFASIFAIWNVVGFLATIPVAGDDPYWRALRAHPSDFDLVAEDVSFSQPRIGFRSRVGTYAQPARRSALSSSRTG